jgi:hypothetical protein
VSDPDPVVVRQSQGLVRVTGRGFGWSVYPCVNVDHFSRHGHGQYRQGHLCLTPKEAADLAAALTDMVCAERAAAGRRPA